MRPDALRARSLPTSPPAGSRCVVVANAGTTAAGAIDPFSELAQICASTGIWLHVDGAYGAFAASRSAGARRWPAWSSPTRSRSTRTSGSTSRSRWARCSSARARSARGFEIVPDFLKDIEAADREVNFSDLGVQLTRSCRALKLWISLRYFGVAAFRQAIDRCIDLALHAQTQVEARPNSS